MNIAIIGAGATGLAAAHDLLNAGHKVTVFEAGAQPGGLAGGFKQDNWNWSLEKFYHHWFESDADLLKLASEIGVRERVMYLRPKTVSYYDGKFVPLDSPLAALMFPGLSLIGKLRFGLAGLYLKLTSNWRALEQVTANEWLAKNMGNEAYELLFKPLLIGKFGEAYWDKVNMAWFWARIKSRTTKLGTFDGGFQAFFDVLSEHLIRRGARLMYSTPVQRIERSDESGLWWIKVDHPEFADRYLTFDRVLVTTSPKLFTKLVPQISERTPEYLSSLDGLTSLGAVVMIFAMRHGLSPDGYYWHNIPKSADFPFLCLAEHTNFVSSEHFGGQHLLYVGDYLPPDHAYFGLGESELREIFMSTFKRINPQFEADWVEQTWLFRESYAQPVPFVNHSQHIPSTRTPLPGLHFASMSHVYPWDRGTNYAVRLGRDVAGEMLVA